MALVAPKKPKFNPLCQLLLNIYLLKLSIFIKWSNIMFMLTICENETFVETRKTWRKTQVLDPQ